MNLRVARALLRKELRQLLPLLLALGVFLALTVLGDFILTAPDTHRWAASTFLAGGDVDAGLWTQVVLACFVAQSLLPGEHEQRTIELLFTLPMRRSTIFFAKAAVGGLVLLALAVAANALTLAQAWLNPDSFLRETWNARLLLLETALTGLFFLIALSYGLLLACFRRAGWLLLVLAFVVIKAVGTIHPPFAIFDPAALGRTEHLGTTPLLPWDAWKLHGLLAALALVAAWRLWLTSANRAAGLFDRLRDSRGLRLIAAPLVALLVLVTVVGVVVRRGSGDPQGDGAAEEKVDDRGTIGTAHFVFTYRIADEQAARLVAALADPAYERVKVFLHAPEAARIAVDLTNRSPDHAGLAGRQTMRMALARDSDRAELEYVFFHELSHVFAAELTAASPRPQSFFSEGLAEYASFELLGLAQERRESRRLAALARRRFDLRFADLVDTKELLAGHAESLLYQLGEVWVGALAATCGSEAPSQVARALAAPTLPKELTGAALWREVLQRVSCDLEKVVSAYETQLAAASADIDAIPIASARLQKADGNTLWFSLTARAPSPGPWKVVLRVRDGPDTPANQIAGTSAEVSTGAEATVWVGAHIRGERLQYQVGAAAPHRLPAFSRWQTISR